MLNYLDSVFEYQATMDVLSKYGMPSNLSEFESRPAFSEMVSPKYQNQNLTASLQILANEAVFKYLYINQRSSTQEFKDILSQFGIDLKAITKKSNLFTPTNMIESKVENNMNKDGIGRTAVMNKFLSLASQYNLKLSDKAIVWAYQTMDDRLILKDTFGQLNEQDQRVIAIIGNILGMFADGAKDPIPAALQMNEVNASTTLAMIGIGLDPEFALAFNFLPEVRKAALAVQQSSTDAHDAEAVGKIAREVSVVIGRDASMLNGIDVSTEIRSSEINGIVSIIAAHTPVRDAMREQQRAWIRDHEGGVVEGRDIGTVVFPDAILKIFLTASPEVRAERRVGQNGGDIQAVAASIAERDHLDSTRLDSPLKPSHDSVVVDSSRRTIDEVVAEIVTHFEKVDHG